MAVNIAVLAVLVFCPVYTLQQGPIGASRLSKDPTYFIVAPTVIYPNQVVNVHVSILRLYYDHVNVRASLRMEGEEFASFFETFRMPSTRLLQMRMPPNARPGNYTLRVEGSLLGGLGGNIFENETDITFSQKQVSVFITTNKPVYRQGQEVKFRVIPVHPNLLSVHGSMDIYALDPTGTVVRRWLSLQTNAGILESSMMLADQVTYGTWKIRVDAWGHKYHHSFQVEEFFLPRMYVNVTIPPYIMEDTFALAGLITANHTSGRPVRGNGTLRIEIRKPQSMQKPGEAVPSLEQNIDFFEGRTDFMFRVEELQKLMKDFSEENSDFSWNKPIGQHEVYVEAKIFDWFLLQWHTGSGICVIHSRKITMKLLGDRARTFKPGFPVPVYYAVMHADGTPLISHRRQVTITRTETLQSGSSRKYEDEKLLVRDDGIVFFQFIPDEDAQLIELKAYYDNLQRAEQIYTHLYRHFSPSNSYLHISTSTERPMVNQYMIFTVRSSTWIDRVSYMIAAGGNIIVSNSLEMSATQKTFSVAMSRDMVPSARIVAYYILNGEVVTDSLNFFVNGTRMNPVEVRTNQGKDFSKQTVEITGITDPGAYIAFSAVAFDLYSYRHSNILTENDIISELQTYDAHANGSYGHVWKQRDEPDRNVFFPAPTYGVDANTTFTFAGLALFTDANVSRIPHYCNETRGILPCNDGNCYELFQRCDGTPQCRDWVDEMGCPQNETEIFTPMWQRIKHITRHYEEDGLWAWRSHFVKPDGRIDLPVKVPVEPMAWVIGAFAVSRDHGLGVAPVPTRYESTRYFYMRLELPTNIVYGEQVGIRVALFNYWDADLESLVTLHSSEQYRFVVVGDYGVVSSYNPQLKTGDVQTMVYVEANSMRTIHMPVLPSLARAGCFNVTISVSSFMGQDKVSREICMRFDGVTNYYNTPYLIDLINQGSKIVPDMDIPVREQFIMPEQREHLYVPGSPEATLSIVGDVVGPGFFEPYLNAENYMRKPYGAGENNVFNLAINLYMLKFLKVTNQLRDDVLANGLSYINLGLQRQLSYYNGTEGSFSMFRDYRKPTPSVWLTSFALKIIQNADEADWRIVTYIPTELLNSMASWICKFQNRTTGAFWDPAPMYDRKLKSNWTEENGQQVQKNISLTAYVLIALTEAKGVTGASRTAVDAAKTAAQGYLERNLESVTEVFQTALVTHALTVSSSNKRNEAFKMLNKLKRTTEFTYWADKDIPRIRTKIVNTVHYMQPRDIYPNEGSAVQATSYALMVYLRNNRLREAEPIMQWLQTMRNSIGGFSGTQDTFAALEALTEYGKRDTNRDLYNIRIRLESTSTHGWQKQVDLNRTVWPEVQMVQVPKVWGSIRAVAQGTGFVLMQLQTTKNVEYPRLQGPLPTEKFYDLTERQKLFHGKNFSIFEMTACTRWARPDISQRTGLTVMEIGLPTGYIILNDVLRQYVRSGAVPNLGRAEYYNNKIVYYLDYVDSRYETCVKFRADRWYPVANVTIQHIFKVYDYYETGMFNLSMYTTYDLFNLHICQVCGSFQCPYCGPYYNIATSTIHISITLSVVLISVALYFKTCLTNT